jgi:hypothetical protein
MGVTAIPRFHYGGNFMVFRILFSLALAVHLPGCAYYFPPLHEERIEQYKKTCESIGFKPQSIEYANCVLDLETAYLQNRETIQQSNSSNGGMSFLCRNAISRGDSMAVNIHC